MSSDLVCYHLICSPSNATCKQASDAARWHVPQAAATTLATEMQTHLSARSTTWRLHIYFFFRRLCECMMQAPASCTLLYAIIAVSHPGVLCTSTLNALYAIHCIALRIGCSETSTHVSLTITISKYHVKIMIAESVRVFTPRLSVWTWCAIIQWLGRLFAPARKPKFVFLSATTSEAVESVRVIPG